MTADLGARLAEVAKQGERLPEMYGAIDFDMPPERFAGAPDDETELDDAVERARVLADPRLMALMRAYCLRGDPVADAYAALIPRVGFRRLVQMLVAACDLGLEAVPDAPPELGALLADMERVPQWLDRAMVEEGARYDRNMTVNLLPFIMQVGFVGTFMNKYAALPMALTGTLSSETARRRVLDTSTFMMTTALPGALERFGPGFKACAMVRVMHSMVRFNTLRSGAWDPVVFGLPIPQVDQMPAGLALVTIMSRGVLKSGRRMFTHAERARVELARYRCFLLGLPEDLLPDTPQGLVDIMTARNATLRRGFDEAICGGLVRATLAADLAPDARFISRLRQQLSYSFGKLFFLREYARGDSKMAASFGVRLTPGDWSRIAVAGVLIASTMAMHGLAARIGLFRQVSDRILTRRLQAILQSYGHAEFTTDADAYRRRSSRTA